MRKTMLPILIVALVHGLVYVFLMPPWQHYDEPNHFEYAWLAANRPGLPEVGDYDSGLTYTVVKSMLEHDFYRGLPQPELGTPESYKAVPGYTALHEPPLYYLLVSAPLRLLRSAPIERQLLAGRLVSLLLFLFVVLAGWGSACEITRQGHPLRWLAPLTLALLPPFTDLMTAVNNDGLACAAFAWCFWGCLRLIRRGLSLPNLLWVLIAAGASIYSKNTAYVAVMLIPFAFLFGWLRGRWRKLAWGLTGAGLLAAAVIILRWNAPLFWYRAANQDGSVNRSSHSAILGENVFVVNVGQSKKPLWLPYVYQLLPVEDRQALRGKTVTLGAWMWSSTPTSVDTPRLEIISQSFSSKVQVDQTPRFFAITAQLPEKIFRGWVALDPHLPPGSSVRIYYDGLVLAEGSFPLDQAPDFQDLNGQLGNWAGQPFTNLLRNASAEQTGPGVWQRLDNLSVRVLPDSGRLSIILSSISDLAGTSSYYKHTALYQFEGLWGRFSWGHILLSPHWVFTVLEVLTALCLLGAVLGAWKRRKSLDWAVAMIILLALGVAWGSTFTRGVNFLATPGYYMAPARHASPAHLALVFVLAGGWFSLVELVLRLARNPQPGNLDRLQRILLVVWPVFLVILDGLSLLTITRFYGIFPGG